MDSVYKGKDMVTISAIITTHNRKYEVRRALDSVYSQTEMPDEIILVDDHSSDGTKEYIDFFEFNNLKYIELVDGNGPIGPGVARNIGIQAAQSEYVAFLDSDNEWNADKIKCFKKKLVDNVAIDVLYSRYTILNKTSRLPQPHDLGNVFGDNHRDRAILQNCFDASSTIIRKSLLDRVGGYSDEYTTNIDWELSLRLCCNKELTIGFIDDILSTNDVMYNSLSNNRELEIEERVEIICRYKEIIKEIDKKYTGFFYDNYLKDESIYMDKRDAISKLIVKTSNDEEFIKEIISAQIDEEEKLSNQLNRKNSFYSLLFRWLDNKTKGINTVADNLIKKDIHSVAIYGAGNHGKLLAQELIGSAVEVNYFIDKNDNKNVGVFSNTDKAVEVKVYKLDSDLPTVDAVIVTPYLEIATIRLSLEQKGFKNIISLYDIV